MSRQRPLVSSAIVSSVAAPPTLTGSADSAKATAAPAGPSFPRSDAAVAVVLAALLIALAFGASGGVDSTVATAGNTWSEIALTVISAVVVGAAVLTGRSWPRWALATIAMMAVLTALKIASITWSVLPDDSWLSSSQMLAYLAVFAAGVSLSRLIPNRWAALVGAIAIAGAALSLWSLLIKVFPAALAPNNQVGRLQEPFGYWNALGLIAAIALPCCLWLGARRDSRRRVAGLAAPAMVLLVSVLTLSYSRSADLAACVAVALWLIFVPLRLRALAILAVALAGAAVVSGWALTHRGISANSMPIGAQNSAGHVFGVILLVVLALTTVAGFAIARAADRAEIPLSTRRRVGGVLIAGACLIPFVIVAGLALSSRGLVGEISYGWHELTVSPTSSTNTAGRVLQFGSSRPLYWHEALAVGNHAVLKGVGELGFAAARLRYTVNPGQVQQAHSYVFETYADLGVLGLLATALLLAAWIRGTGRTLQLHRRWSTFSPRHVPEREALVTLTTLVVAFGVQSTLDWTWYFSGVTVPVLLCAGWLVGRGPVTADPTPRARRPLLDRPGAIALVSLLAVATVLGAWMQWRPLRSAQLLAAAENNGGSETLHLARAASADDPFSLYPRELISNIELARGDVAAARAELVKATQLEPGNLQTWAQLGSFDMQRRDFARAIPSWKRVIALDVTPDATHYAAVTQINVAQAVLARAAHRSASPKQ